MRHEPTHLHDPVQRVEGQARKGAHLVALVVLVVDDVQPAAGRRQVQVGGNCTFEPGARECRRSESVNPGRGWQVVEVACATS